MDSRFHSGIALISLTLTLTACGWSDQSGTTAGTTTPVVTPAAPTPTPAPAPTTTTPASVTAVLNIDFANLPNYAAPALPVHYDATVRALDNTPANGPVTDRLATLGRVLFYDANLSVNNSTSCASCHQQASGFDDPARFSTGFSGSAFTTAHAMRLGNVRYSQPGTMFWNRRAASLEAQASQPIINEIEMGFTAAAGGIGAMLTKIQARPYYSDLFTFAYGDPVISEARVQTALTAFQRALISSSSRWDTAYAQVYSASAPNRNIDVNLPGFTAQENQGRHLFMATRQAGGLDCASCHIPPTFALDRNSDSNGLDAGETVRFKSPSLKNVGLSHAFMHDGRFSTLAQVIEFYDNGVQAGPALDNRLIAGNAPRRLNLSAADKAALVAFLQTLDDPTLNTDPRFSNPFR